MTAATWRTQVSQLSLFLLLEYSLLNHFFHWKNLTGTLRNVLRVNRNRSLARPLPSVSRPTASSPYPSARLSPTRTSARL